MKRRMYLYLVFSLILSTNLNAHAMSMIDQFNPVKFDISLLSDTYAGPDSFYHQAFDVAQTFTVGKSGWLQEIEVYTQVREYGNYYFDVRTTQNGIPLENNNSTLAYLSLTPEYFIADIEGYVSFDISQFHLMVNEGDVLAFVLRAGGSGIGNINGNIYDPYLGGRTFHRYLSAYDPTWTGFLSEIDKDWDFGFKTYVHPVSDCTQPVPEPSSIALLMGGIFSLVGFVKSKKFY